MAGASILDMILVLGMISAAVRVSIHLTLPVSAIYNRGAASTFHQLLDIPATAIAPTILNAVSTRQPTPSLTPRLLPVLYPPIHLAATTAIITVTPTITIQTRTLTTTATTTVRTFPPSTAPVPPALPAQRPVLLLPRIRLGSPPLIPRAVVMWVGRVLGASLVLSRCSV
jgi:hypothetical protein